MNDEKEIKTGKEIRDLLTELDREWLNVRYDESKYSFEKELHEKEIQKKMLTSLRNIGSVEFEVNDITEMYIENGFEKFFDFDEYLEYEINQISDPYFKEPSSYSCEGKYTEISFENLFSEKMLTDRSRIGSPVDHHIWIKAYTKLKPSDIKKSFQTNSYGKNVLFFRPNFVNKNWNKWIYFIDSEPKRSIVKGPKEGCFIATVTFGEMHPVVKDLRKYRDDVLGKSFLGRWFINKYYYFGPFASKVVKKSRTLLLLSRQLISFVHKYFITKRIN